ncbi:arginine--tRNA ligase [Bacillus sp. Hm123]|uniref:arginine--tRNA ligase n=1 Tax=Bacillus sp. Hm123 TaxID=3450745 RepID=UPI003F43004B
MEVMKIFAEEIAVKLDNVVALEEIMAMIEKPKYAEQGDVAFPCFSLAKLMKKSPQLIAADLASQIEHPLFDTVIANGAYVNGFLKKQIVSEYVLTDILQQGANYGHSTYGQGKVITMDFSSPNIAKPFSMGHLRSTVIGNAIANIAEKSGYQTVRINHLGDWGTQFGKLITAYKRWGSEEQVKQQPIQELLRLYVTFHDEAEYEPSLEVEARMWFKKLEDGDEEAKRLWKWFKDESLIEFSKIYDLMDIRFDSLNGEAFYNESMDETVQLLQDKGLLQESDGAEVVDLQQDDLPPCLIKKSDGATLYATRDLTAAIYRQHHYQFDQALYVVGHEQSLHFKQVFLTLEKMGYEWAKGMVHIPFGFILKDGKKMSTRKGKVVLLERVIEEAIELAKQSIEEKNPQLARKEEVAKAVGVGAIIFHDLKQERQGNIEFSLEDMLKFEGTTGPYVQYTHARACSIMRKSECEINSPAGLNDDYSWAVIKLLMEFPAVIERSLQQYEPSQIAKYVIDLSQEFNKYYSHVKILVDDAEKESRLALVKAVTIVLAEGLRLLGIKAPVEM